MKEQKKIKWMLSVQFNDFYISWSINFPWKYLKSSDMTLSKQTEFDTKEISQKYYYC